MRLKYIILIGGTLLARTAFSQEEPSKVDLYGAYSYLRFNPALPGVQGHNLNGGGAGATFFLDNHFGVEGELMGYETAIWTAMPLRQNQIRSPDIRRTPTGSASGSRGGRSSHAWPAPRALS